MMTELSPSNDSVPPTPNARPRAARWPALLAWLVIAGLVGFIVYRNVQANAVRKGGAPLGETQVRLTGQFAIQINALKRQTSALLPATLNENIDRLILQMEREARTPEGLLRVAIIAGEVQGKDIALARLDTLSKAQTALETADDIATLRGIYTEGPEAIDASAQNRLIQRHDYFARVALSYGVGPDTEPRKSVEASASRTVARFSVVAFGLLLVIMASIGLFIAAIIFALRGRFSRAYVSDPYANSAFLEGFALYLFLFVIGLGLVVRQFGLVSVSWQWLALFILPILMYWLSRRGIDTAGLQKGLGWHVGRGWGKEIVAGAAGYLAGLVFVVLGMFVTLLLVRRTGAPPEHPIAQMLQGDVWHVLQLYAVACVFAPLLEETMFRGALFHHLRRRWGWWISAPTVAFIFAIIHPQGWVAAPALGSIAMVLAALREWRGSLIAPMAAHAMNNFIALTVALMVLR